MIEPSALRYFLLVTRFHRAVTPAMKHRSQTELSALFLIEKNVPVKRRLQALINGFSQQPATSTR